MDKFIKIQSVEGGLITDTNNIRTYDIPEGHVFDLRDSFLQFNCKMDVVETTPDGGTGIYNTGVQWVTTATNKPHFQNVAFVKNADLKSMKKGQIDSCRRVDILRNNLAVLGKSQSEELSEAYLNINQIVPAVNGGNFGIFGSFNKSGAVKSLQYSNVPIQIRLSDISDFCSTDEYDSTRGGALRLRVELNRDKLEAVHLGANANIRPNPNVLRFMNVLTASGTGNKVVMGTDTTQLRVQNLLQSPYFVGQKLLMNADGTGTGAPSNVRNKPAVIKSITYTRGNADQSLGGKIELEFEEDWGVALTGNMGYNKVFCTIAECTPTLVIDSAEIVLKKKNDGDLENYDSINYTMFNLEQGNGNARTSFQNVFTLEPEATQAIMMFAQGNDNLVSSCPINSYRLSLNNQQLTDRDVVTQSGTAPANNRSPLYYDRLGSTLRGAGYRLKNLVQNGGISDSDAWANTYTDDEFKVVPVVGSLFQTTQQKFLQTNIEAGTGGVNAFQLYKAVPRVFSY